MGKIFPHETTKRAKTGAELWAMWERALTVQGQPRYSLSPREARIIAGRAAFIQDVFCPVTRGDVTCPVEFGLGPIDKKL